ncbi:MAG: hypothetical protein AB2448_01915, partial [Moorella sp. (in: firmicutes)]
GLAAAAPGNGKLYAVGGNTGSATSATNEEYDPSTNTWTAKAAMPTVRNGLAAAAPGNGKLYAVGGNTGSATSATNEEYDPSTNTWTAKAAMPTVRNGLAAAAPGNGKLYAVGGNGPSAINEEYDPRDIVLAPVKAGDIVYSFGVSLKVGSQTIPVDTPTTVSADGNLVFSEENLNYAWIQRP